MNDLIELHEHEDTASPEKDLLLPRMLRAFSASDRSTLLPAVGSAVSLCGGWVLERRSRSSAELEIVFEVQLGSIEDLYVELVRAGLEFTRPAHAALTELCVCRRHFSPAPGCGEILTCKLDILFFTQTSLDRSDAQRAVHA